MIGHWRLLPEARRSRCPRYAIVLTGGGVVHPTVVMALPLEVVSLRTRFCGAIVDLEELFEVGFEGVRGERF